MSLDKYFDFAGEAFDQHKKLNIFVKILFYLIVISSNLMFLLLETPYLNVFIWLFLLYLSPTLILVIGSKKNAKLVQSFIIFFVTLQSISILFCFSTVRDDIGNIIFEEYEVHSEITHDSDGDEINVDVFETGSEFFNFTLSMISDYSFFLIIFIYLGGMPLHHLIYKTRFLDDNDKDQINNSA